MALLKPLQNPYKPKLSLVFLMRSAMFSSLWGHRARFRSNSASQCRRMAAHLPGTRLAATKWILLLLLLLLYTSIAISLDILTVVDSRLQLSHVRVEERGRGSTSRSTMPQSCLVKCALFKCAPQVVLRCSPLEFHWTLASTWRHHAEP